MTVLADPGRSAAVLVGVHDYVHLDGLPAVERNLEGLRRVLTDPDVWGLPAEACAVIAQPASVREVLDAVREKARQATDTLLVYYAGHGVVDNYSDELYLALPDTDREREYTALRFESLRREVLDPQARAQRTVVVLDCCYSGRALVGSMGAGKSLADRTAVNGTVVLTASAATREALALPGEPYTAFTGELVDLLERGIPGGPELLDMDTLYRQLYARLAEKSRPLPQQRNRNTGGRIAIARNRAAGVEGESPRDTEARAAAEARATAEELLAWREREVERLRAAAEEGARELLHRATRLAAALAAEPDPDFRPFWLAVPAVREVFGTDGSLEPVGELVPGTWYLALAARGDALLVRHGDGAQGILLDCVGIQNGSAEAEFELYWFAVPVVRPLFDAGGGSLEPVGELVPGTWYLALAAAENALLVQLPDGTKGLLLDVSGIQKGVADRSDPPPKDRDDFTPFWFAVPAVRQLFEADGSPVSAGELVPGEWYLAVGQQADALTVQLPDGARWLLLDSTGIQRG
ncbi:caspase family protein [Kitasatospora sp. NPDC056531]|uniref:caspase, EACC1-associated type n=1 Tax=Kitasatospora sp. NPDC056531 TaxID=3345856 RepID=UPI00369E9C0F